MAGSYSGNLVRTWTNPDWSANFRPDPAHAVRDTPQEYPTTDQVYANTGVEFSGTEMPLDMAVGDGVVLGAPSRSHNGLGGRRQVYSNDQHREDLRILHAEDGQRRYLAHKFVAPPLQSSGEVYSDSYEESPDIYGTPNNTGAVAVMRGIDGNPQNNPEGVRRGWDRRGPWMEAARLLNRRRYRYHAQPLIQRDYYVPVNQPPVPGAGPDIVSMQLFKQAGTLTAVKRPAMFRTPPEVDSSWLAQDQAGTGDVIGGEVI